jgi:hypothetical protein
LETQEKVATSFNGRTLAFGAGYLSSSLSVVAIHKGIMSDLKLGERAPEKEVRDAVHVAVTSVIAGQSLDPGAPVTLREGKAWSAATGGAIGITDPFGPTVNEGYWVVVLMHPAVSSSVRHAWELKSAEEIARAIEDHEQTQWCRQACGHDGDY